MIRTNCPSNFVLEEGNMIPFACSQMPPMATMLARWYARSDPVYSGRIKLNDKIRNLDKDKGRLSG